MILAASTLHPGYHPYLERIMKRAAQTPITVAADVHQPPVATSNPPIVPQASGPPGLPGIVIGNDIERAESTGDVPGNEVGGAIGGNVGRGDSVSSLRDGSGATEPNTQVRVNANDAHDMTDPYKS